MPKRRVHVAAAAIFNDQGKVLIARRPSIADQGGLWEFPGGKLAPFETGLEALKRELREELGVSILRAQPLIRVHHEYPDKHILLDVWETRHFEGEPWGREGQAVRWVAPAELQRYSFPEANGPIVSAVTLPHDYMITGEEQDEQRFDHMLERALVEDGIRLVQLRAHGLDEVAYRARAERALEKCHAHSAELIINGSPETFHAVGADGLHLPSRALMSLNHRPIGNDQWLSASTHNLEQIQQAQRIECDFATLSPVRETPSHPGAVTIGWHDLQQMVERVTMPVYALGGTRHVDSDRARAVGAQGIASIREFWHE
ncbi:Nudix family hydrolase [Kushneria aurantia]|uniref:8-oxo-dGTP diphosphatase n=1 Tax=Kushneria aurantia TaxID=504092 RepID=A0ABV6FZX4_9GAMM|nr:Nudix family hydrolase [Kushneria aurantia]